MNGPSGFLGLIVEGGTSGEEGTDPLRRKLEEVETEIVGQGDHEQEAAASVARLMSVLDDATRSGESKRDALSTELMEVLRVHRSRAAFGLLYELNGQHLLQQVTGRLRRYQSKADPQDVLQEVFVNVYRYPQRLNSAREDAFRVWTATIVRNTVLKHMRSLSRSGRAEVAFEDLPEPSGNDKAEPLSGAIETESREECARVYLTYLYLYLHFHRMLSEREQRAIHLVEVDGFSYRAAAAELGIKLENLKMVIFRARRKIHRSMRRVFDGLPPDLRPARDPKPISTRVAGVVPDATGQDETMEPANPANNEQAR